MATVSFRQGKGNLNHNRRVNVSANVDPSRIKDNVSVVERDLVDVYEQIFGAAIAEYDQNQKRADRRIGSANELLKKFKKDKKQKVFREVIGQIGNIEDNKDPEFRAKAVEISKEYLETFEQRNPHFVLFDAKIHCDEASIHFHADFVPAVENKDSKRGLSVKNSMKLALQQMYPDSNEMEAFKQWSERERQYLAELAQKREIAIEAKNEPKRAYRTCDEERTYRSELQRLEEQIKADKAKIEQMQKQIVELKRENLNFEAKKEQIREELDRLDEILWTERSKVKFIQQVDIDELQEFIESKQIQVDDDFDLYSFCNVTSDDVAQTEKGTSNEFSR
ncbi:MAG: plasmid recombination protein [Culicoidibacterales bacterium]